MNPIELNLFASRMDAVCEEMGEVMREAALSPNIRDRLDFSCAVFDPQGELCAQAAHIPVHLGSMAYAMRDIVSRLAWAPGDMVILNDPFLGGTHLPDVTLIAPVFVDGALAAFAANRAHHADIGASSPGSMPVSSTLAEEGQVITPTHLLRAGKVDEAILGGICAATGNPRDARGDFSAQISANRVGVERLRGLIESYGLEGFYAALHALNEYGERLALESLGQIPDGEYLFEDLMDDDGQGHSDIPIRLRLRCRGGRIEADFSGTASQVSGNINCPLSVTAAGVYYVFRCLMPARTPACAGIFRSIRTAAPRGCLLNAEAPAAVAAGNVETSSRVVDVVMGALAQAIPELIPAASQGSMNNVAMGSADPAWRWDYYETVGGGMGAGASGGGLSAVQTHMTNTLNTPIELLERHFPLRLTRYAMRVGSGGSGVRPGGDGLVREYEFLRSAQVTLLTERRRHRPWGLAGGGPGRAGRNLYNGREVAAKTVLHMSPGDRLTIETPGGGGWGE